MDLPVACLSLLRLVGVAGSSVVYGLLCEFATGAWLGFSSQDVFLMVYEGELCVEAGCAACLYRLLGRPVQVDGQTIFC